MFNGKKTNSVSKYLWKHLSTTGWWICWLGLKIQHWWDPKPLHLRRITCGLKDSVSNQISQRVKILGNRGSIKKNIFKQIRHTRNSEKIQSESPESPCYRESLVAGGAIEWAPLATLATLRTWLVNGHLRILARFFWVIFLSSDCSFQTSKGRRCHLWNVCSWPNTGCGMALWAWKTFPLMDQFSTISCQTALRPCTKCFAKWLIYMSMDQTPRSLVNTRKGRSNRLTWGGNRPKKGTLGFDSPPRC